jgi:hypothetical protein
MTTVLVFLVDPRGPVGVILLMKRAPRSEENDGNNNRLEQARFHQCFLKYLQIEVIRLFLGAPSCNGETGSVGRD